LSRCGRYHYLSSRSKNAEALQQVGIEHCVLETDSPDMPMYGRQGQRNEPAYLSDVLSVLDHAFPELTGNQIACITSHNVQRIWRIERAS